MLYIDTRVQSRVFPQLTVSIYFKGYMKSFAGVTLFGLVFNLSRFFLFVLKLNDLVDI